MNFKMMKKEKKGPVKIKCDILLVIPTNKKNNYYQKIDEEIKEEFSLYILSSGFTDEIYEDIYEYDNLVSKDTNAIYFTKEKD